MYESFYKLQDKPFQLSPDPRYFFSSKGHGKAMAYLVYGVNQGEGFIVITGEIGSGKTMLASALARNVASGNIVLAQVVSTSLNADDIVRTVAAAFGLPEEKHKAILLKRLEQFLLASHKQGQRALLLVDEAQNLPVKSLEELRMLSNFTYAHKPLLQTFLLGQPEFRETLQSRSLDQLRQRVIASCHLGPLDVTETEAYITHRLHTAGWGGDPTFSGDVFPAIHKYTEGIPRKINILCDRLMLMGRLERKHAFSAEDVAEVISELRKEFAFAPSRPVQGIDG